MADRERNRIELSYDPDGDMLEIVVEGEAAVTYPTENKNVMVRVDDSGAVVGVMVSGVSSLGEQPFDLKLAAAVSSRMVTTNVAANEMGISVRRLQALLNQGRVRGAERVGRDWLVPAPTELVPGSRGPVGVAMEGKRVPKTAVRSH